MAISRLRISDSQFLMVPILIGEEKHKICLHRDDIKPNPSNSSILRDRKLIIIRKPKLDGSYVNGWCRHHGLAPTFDTCTLYKVAQSTQHYVFLFNNDRDL